MEYLILLASIYFGIGLYEFYRSSLMGAFFNEALINALAWPIDLYYEIKNLIKGNYIDKDGP